MFLFYNDNGKIRGACGAGSPNDELTYIPEGTTSLYCDDNEYPDIGNNLSDYTIQNNILVYTPIPDIIKLPPLQEAKIEEINIACNKEILDGFDSNILGDESNFHHYKFDMEYQANFSEMANILNIDDTITEINWPVDGFMVIHTKQQFISLLKEARDHKSGKLERYFDLKEQIMNCQSTDEVGLINW